MQDTVIKILGATVAVCVVGLLYGFPIMWLWNWLMPKLFHLPTINFWESLGLFMLCHALFGNSSSSSKND